MHKASISEDMNVWYASRGVQTIGSHPRLKLVLTMTGEPVRAANRRSSRSIPSVPAGVHRLDRARSSRRASRRECPIERYRAGRCRLRRAAPRSGRRCSRRTDATVSMYGSSAPGGTSKYSWARSCSTAGANGRKLSRNLTLRFMTDCMRWSRGVAEEAPRAERARSELHAVLKPSDHPAVSQFVHDRVAHRVVVGQVLRGRTGLLDEGTDRFVGVGRPQPGGVLRIVGRDPPRLAEQLMPDEERRSKSAPGVARRGLDPDAFEGAFAQDAAVRHAVQGHATGQTEIAGAGLLVDVRGGAEHRPPPPRAGSTPPRPCDAA